MSSANDGRQAIMDSSQIYREETYTDRRVGTIRCLTPVTAEGTADAARPVLYVGQAQIMTPMGALPISFDLEASTLERRHRQIRRSRRAGRAADHARAAGAAPRAGLLAGDSGCRRGGSMPNPSDLLGRGGRSATLDSAAERFESSPARVRRLELRRPALQARRGGARLRRPLPEQCRIAQARIAAPPARPRAAR